MAESLRNIFKKSELARNIRDEIRQLNFRQVIRRLRDNNLNDQGHTDELADRLIRFEIREVVPDITVAWYPERDVANFTDYESATTSEVESVTGDDPTIRMCNKSRDQDQDDSSEQIQVEATIHEPPKERNTEKLSDNLQSEGLILDRMGPDPLTPTPHNALVHPDGSAPQILRAHGQIQGNARLFVSKEVHMLHGNEGHMREFRHLAQASNVVFEAPPRHQDLLQPRTSTVIRQAHLSRVNHCDGIRDFSEQREPEGEIETAVKNAENLGAIPRRRLNSQTPRKSMGNCRKSPAKESPLAPRSTRSRIIKEPSQQYTHTNRSDTEYESDNYRIPYSDYRKLKRLGTEPKKTEKKRGSTVEDREENRPEPRKKRHIHSISSEDSYHGKNSSANRSERELALEKELNECKKLLEKIRVRKSQSSDSERSERRGTRPRTEKVRYVQSNEESSEDSDNDYRPVFDRPRYNRMRYRGRETDSQCIERIRKNINDYRLNFSGDKKNAEEFLEQLTDCYESCEAPADLWLQSIRRVFKGKAREWYKNNKSEFTSWNKFKSEFKERFFGIVDEDDLWDELRMKVQGKNESIADYVDSFQYLVSRFRHAPSLKSQLDIIYKNLLPEYRKHMINCEISTYRELLRHGKSFEKERKIDERQAQLSGKSTDRFAAMDEKSDDIEKKGKQSSGKSKGKRSKQDTVESSQEVAAAQENKFPMQQQQRPQQAPFVGQQQPWKPPKFNRGPPPGLPRQGQGFPYPDLRDNRNQRENAQGAWSNEKRGPVQQQVNLEQMQERSLPTAEAQQQPQDLNQANSG